MLDAKWINFLTIFIDYSVNIKVSYKQADNLTLWKAVSKHTIFVVSNSRKPCLAKVTFKALPG